MATGVGFDYGDTQKMRSGLLLRDKDRTKWGHEEKKISCPTWILEPNLTNQ
ncbi:MAG: hypothetical protein IBX41_00165 [Methanophagales archaeon]|nr:hypothetical protein [Methanophagales archaeon]